MRGAPYLLIVQFNGLPGPRKYTRSPYTVRSALPFCPERDAVARITIPRPAAMQALSVFTGPPYLSDVGDATLGLANRESSIRTFGRISLSLTNAWPFVQVVTQLNGIFTPATSR